VAATLCTASATTSNRLPSSEFLFVHKLEPVNTFPLYNPCNQLHGWLLCYSAGIHLSFLIEFVLRQLIVLDKQAKVK
jgi:hypothetical protein